MENNEKKNQETAKRLAPALCIGLALSAIDAMAMSVSHWDAKELRGAELEDPASPEGRLSAIAEQAVESQRASQSMGHAWFALSERMEVDGKPLTALYEEEGISGLMLAQATSTDAAGACYTACYGNCYGNCYSNCYSACHGADS